MPGRGQDGDGGRGARGEVGKVDFSALSFGRERGLEARDRRRQGGGSVLVWEPPRAPYVATLLLEGMGVLRSAQDVVRSLVGVRSHSTPPRVWYRLVSLGRPRKGSEGDSFTVVQDCLLRGGVLVVPAVGFESVEQVLVVDRRTRLVYEVASRVGDGCWGLRGVLRDYSRRACFVLVMGEGRSEYLRCRDVPVVRRHL
jgi:hypothetical protein